METLWYGLVAVMLAIYVVLDGFDLGVGILHRWVARTDAERQQVLRAIGPVWDANEVWLLASGGLLFLAFPHAYAAGFSGFYLPLMMVLWLLILRGLAIELRGHLESALWRSFWDSVLPFASASLAVVLGAALANVIRGVPLGPEGYFQMPLFTDFRVGGPPGVLDPYTVLAGVFTLLALANHGALYLVWKTLGPVQARARSFSHTGSIALCALAVPLTWLTWHIHPELFRNLGQRLLALPAGLLSMAGVALWIDGILRRRELPAFLGSSFTLLGLLALTAVGAFPVLLRSTLSPVYDVTAFNAAVSSGSLRTALVWFSCGAVLVVGYFAFLFRSLRGKVQA